jgi:flagellar motor switch protein FliM
MSQVLDSISTPSFLAICQGQPLQEEILIAIDRPLLLSALEMMLGGEATSAPEATDREFTAIERGFGNRLAKVVLEEFQRSLSTVCQTKLELVRTETDPDGVNIASPASLCVQMKLSIAMQGVTGVLELVLPYDALEPIRQKLGKIHFGERIESEGIWRDSLSTQIRETNVDLIAVFSESELPIRSITGWEPGSILELDVEEEQGAIIECVGTPLFRAVLGQKNNGNVAIQIEEELDANKEKNNGRNNH